MPKIEFSKWYHWSERHLIKNSDLPGMYLLTKFDKAPEGFVDPLDKHIIYIGETSRSLKRRWKEFDNSAFHDTAGHSGGWRYKYTYGDNGKDLYVAAMPVKYVFESDRIKNNFIRYIERKLIWEISRQYPQKQFLNKK